MRDWRLGAGEARDGGEGVDWRSRPVPEPRATSPDPVVPSVYRFSSMMPATTRAMPPSFARRRGLVEQHRADRDRPPPLPVRARRRRSLSSARRASPGLQCGAQAETGKHQPARSEARQAQRQLHEVAADRERQRGPRDAKHEHGGHVSVAARALAMLVTGATRTLATARHANTSRGDRATSARAAAPSSAPAPRRSGRRPSDGSHRSRRSPGPATQCALSTTDGGGPTREREGGTSSRIHMSSSDRDTPRARRPAQERVPQALLSILHRHRHEPARMWHRLSDAIEACEGDDDAARRSCIDSGDGHAARAGRAGSRGRPVDSPALSRRRPRKPLHPAPRQPRCSGEPPGATPTCRASGAIRPPRRSSGLRHMRAKSF